MSLQRGYKSHVGVRVAVCRVCSTAGTLQQQQHWPALAAPSSFSWQPERSPGQASAEQAHLFCLIWEQLPFVPCWLPAGGNICKVTLSNCWTPKIWPGLLLCWQLMGAAEPGLSTQHSLEAPFKPGREMLTLRWIAVLIFNPWNQVRVDYHKWQNRVVATSAVKAENFSLDFLGVYPPKNALNS